MVFTTACKGYLTYRGGMALGSSNTIGMAPLAIAEYKLLAMETKKDCPFIVRGWEDLRANTIFMIYKLNLNLWKKLN